MANRRLDGMVALVTGAGGGEKGGIGAGICRCLATQGARIAVNDLTNESASAAVGQLRAAGVDAWPVLGSVADSAEAAALVATTVERYGRLDILVNNAGVRGRSLVEHTPDEEWLQVIGVNLNGPFFTSRAAVPLMRAQGFGRIINISSVAAIVITTVSGASYTTTKSALLGLTRHLAAEVAQYGITVNAIMPGFTLTKALETKFAETAKATMKRSIPAQQVGTVEDIGGLAAFLASREAGYLTGAAIPVDGAISVLPGDFTAFRAYTENYTG